MRRTVPAWQTVAAASIMGPWSTRRPLPIARLVTGRFLLVCGSTLAFFTAIGINIPVLPLFIERELHRSDIAVGFTVTTLSLAAVVARPLLGLAGRRFGQQRLMVAGGLLGAVGFGLCAARA